jgi:hypothetical protein
VGHYADTGPSEGRYGCKEVPLPNAALKLCLAAAILMATSSLYAWGDERLGSYAVDPNAISISGVSSGGYMAQQYHVAHSRQIMGVGIVAAGPWDCAETQPGWLPLATAAQICSHTAENGLPFLGPPNLAASITATKDAARTRQIDPTKSLANAKVFLFSGTKDSLEPQSVVDELNQYYLTFIPAGNVRYVNNVPAEHAMVTDRYGNACGHLGSPYINNCGYDAAGEMLKFIYGALNPAGDPASGKLLEFDQTEFLPFEAISMAPVGHVFVPTDCQATPGCRLHVAFHGCLQYPQLIGDAFYAQAGYNRWAATNRIIVLYPQTVASDAAPFNPNGCWDWFAYTDSHFATRSGMQIVAVSKMIARLSDSGHH